MGVSFSSPSSEVTNFHQLSALDIDKKEVNFNTVDGKVSCPYAALLLKSLHLALVILHWLHAGGAGRERGL